MPGTFYDNLAKHLAKHIYTRGKFKGDAPADRSRRGKSHYRVSNLTDGSIAVVFWNTNIIVARPDGSIRIDCEGYADKNTTKGALNEALWYFKPDSWGLRIGVFSDIVKGGRTLCIKDVDGKTYRYYDGIEFGADGRLASQPLKFEGVRIDKSQVAELNEELDASGFKAMFPIIHAGIIEPFSYFQVRDAFYQRNIEAFSVVGAHSKYAVINVLGSSDYADLWPYVVAHYSFHGEYSYTARKHVYTKREAKAVWAAMMRAIKQHMKETYDTGIDCISK